jgi:hypothetical protein
VHATEPVSGGDIGEVARIQIAVRRQAVRVAFPGDVGQ